MQQNLIIWFWSQESTRDRGNPRRPRSHSVWPRKQKYFSTNGHTPRQNDPSLKVIHACSIFDLTFVLAVITVYCVITRFVNFEFRCLIWFLVIKIIITEWSVEECVRLIEEYHKREVLWHPENCEYYNKFKKIRCVCRDAWLKWNFLVIFPKLLKLVTFFLTRGRYWTDYRGRGLTLTNAVRSLIRVIVIHWFPLPSFSLRYSKLVRKTTPVYKNKNSLRRRTAMARNAYQWTNWFTPNKTK